MPIDKGFLRKRYSAGVVPRYTDQQKKHLQVLMKEVELQKRLEAMVAEPSVQYYLERKQDFCVSCKDDAELSLYLMVKKEVTIFGAWSSQLELGKIQIEASGVPAIEQNVYSERVFQEFFDEDIRKTIEAVFSGKAALDPRLDLLVDVFKQMKARHPEEDTFRTPEGIVADFEWLLNYLNENKQGLEALLDAFKVL